MRPLYTCDSVQCSESAEGDRRQQRRCPRSGHDIGELLIGMSRAAALEGRCGRVADEGGTCNDTNALGVMEQVRHVRAGELEWGGLDEQTNAVSARKCQVQKACPPLGARSPKLANAARIRVSWSSRFHVTYHNIIITGIGHQLMLPAPSINDAVAVSDSAHLNPNKQRPVALSLILPLSSTRSPVARQALCSLLRRTTFVIS